MMSNFYQMCANGSSRECDASNDNDCGIEFKYQHVPESESVSNVIGEFFDSVQLVSCEDAKTRLSHKTGPVGVAYLVHGILGGVILGSIH